MPRAKFIDFVFPIPITKIEKKEGLFAAIQVGELKISGRARIDADKLEELPAAFAEGTDWLETSILKVEYQGIDIQPVLTLTGGREMMVMIHSMARNHVRTIYDNENF